MLAGEHLFPYVAMLRGGKMFVLESVENGTSILRNPQHDMTLEISPIPYGEGYKGIIRDSGGDWISDKPIYGSSRKSIVDHVNNLVTI